MEAHRLTHGQSSRIHRGSNFEPPGDRPLIPMGAEP